MKEVEFGMDLDTWVVFSLLGVGEGILGGGENISKSVERYESTVKWSRLVYLVFVGDAWGFMAENICRG